MLLQNITYFENKRCNTVHQLPVYSRVVQGVKVVKLRSSGWFFLPARVPLFWNELYCRLYKVNSKLSGELYKQFHNQRLSDIYKKNYDFTSFYGKIMDLFSPCAGLTTLYILAKDLCWQLLISRSFHLNSTNGPAQTPLISFKFYTILCQF